MIRKLLSASLMLCVSACIGPGGPTDLDREVAVWRRQDAFQDAALNADLAHHAAQRAVQQANADDAERQSAARFAAGVAAQQLASARLTPIMHACVTAGVHRQAAENAPSPPQAADAILAECRPSIVAVARTVELAGLSSNGLAADIGARLWPRLVAGIKQERARHAQLMAVRQTH